jgi:hypothetical protein
MTSAVRSISVRQSMDRFGTGQWYRPFGRRLDRMTPSALIAFYVAPRFEDINLK